MEHLNLHLLVLIFCLNFLCILNFFFLSTDLLCYDWFSEMKLFCFIRLKSCSLKLFYVNFASSFRVNKFCLFSRELFLRKMIPYRSVMVLIHLQTRPFPQNCHCYVREFFYLSSFKPIFENNWFCFTYSKLTLSGIYPFLSPLENLMAGIHSCAKLLPLSFIWCWCFPFICMGLGGSVKKERYLYSIYFFSAWEPFPDLSFVSPWRNDSWESMSIVFSVMFYWLPRSRMELSNPQLLKVWSILSDWWTIYHWSMIH